MKDYTIDQMKDGYTIEPLSDSTIEQAIKMLDEIFPYEKNGSEPPGIYLRASLDKNKYNDILSSSEITELKYWVAIHNGKVVGNTGWYEYASDKDASWLGWTGVSVQHRGFKIGKTLIDMMLKEVQKSGKKYMRLYTSSHPNEMTAYKYYKKIGFIDFKDPEKIQGSDYVRYYLEKQLN